MRILLTGSQQILGYNLLSYLIDHPKLLLRCRNGQRKTVHRIDLTKDFSSNGSSFEIPSDPRIVQHNCTIHEANENPDLLGKDTELVFHLETVTAPYCTNTFDYAYYANVEGTRKLLEACRHLGEKPCFVFASSAAIYDGIESATAQSPHGIQTTYGSTKICCEYLVLEYSRQEWIDGRSLVVPMLVLWKANSHKQTFISKALPNPFSTQERLLSVHPSTRVLISDDEQIARNFIEMNLLPPPQFIKERVSRCPGTSSTFEELLTIIEDISHESLAPVLERIDSDVQAMFDRYCKEMPPKTDQEKFLSKKPLKETLENHYHKLLIQKEKNLEKELIQLLRSLNDWSLNNLLQKFSDLLNKGEFFARFGAYLSLKADPLWSLENAAACDQKTLQDLVNDEKPRCICFLPTERLLKKEQVFREMPSSCEAWSLEKITQYLPQGYQVRDLGEEGVQDQWTYRFIVYKDHLEGNLRARALETLLTNMDKQDEDSMILIDIFIGLVLHYPYSSVVSFISDKYRDYLNWVQKCHATAVAIH
ncbi:MAG: hypothetical protein CMO81_01570 [Waddliaceae bacterium]|nr:hypothetical protein [Waddliaceae bacterium]